jgi:hypothetical protein
MEYQESFSLLINLIFSFLRGQRHATVEEYFFKSQESLATVIENEEDIEDSKPQSEVKKSLFRTSSV